MEWKDTLKDILAREALNHFNERYADKEEFFKHMAMLTGVNDWSEDFIKCCYDAYLEKINTFGNQLNASRQA